jgi:polyhydroxyalkanoate synthesis regulator phasin
MKRIVAFVPAMFLAACAGTAPTPPSYDVGSGRFLTAEEYAKLSRDEAKDYCDQLAAEMDIQRDNSRVAEEELASAQPQVAGLESRLAEAKSATAALSSEVDELERRLRALKERPASYTVKQDDWLWKIARSPGVYGDEKGWSRIYEANRGKISNPDLIYPGMVLDIPR